MNKIKYEGAIQTITPAQPDKNAKKIPAYAGKSILTDGSLLYESGQDPQGKDVARTYATLRTNRDIVVDDSHTQTRATAQFIVTGDVTPTGLQQQKAAAKALLIALCANNFAELDLRLMFNGTQPSALTDARLTAVEAAAVEV